MFKPHLLALPSTRLESLASPFSTVGEEPFSVDGPASVLQWKIKSLDSSIFDNKDMVNK